MKWTVSDDWPGRGEMLVAQLVTVWRVGAVLNWVDSSGPGVKDGGLLGVGATVQVKPTVEVAAPSMAVTVVEKVPATLPTVPLIRPLLSMDNPAGSLLATNESASNEATTRETESPSKLNWLPGLVRTGGLESLTVQVNVVLPVVASCEALTVGV